MKALRDVGRGLDVLDVSSCSIVNLRDDDHHLHKNDRLVSGLGKTAGRHRWGETHTVAAMMVQSSIPTCPIMPARTHILKPTMSTERATSVPQIARISGPLFSSGGSETPLLLAMMMK